MAYINLAGNVTVKDQVFIIIPVDQNGSNIYDGKEIYGAKNLTDLKNNVVLICPVDQNGNSLFG